jgi:hypothetical protein
MIWNARRQRKVLLEAPQQKQALQNGRGAHTISL